MATTAFVINFESHGTEGKNTLCYTAGSGGRQDEANSVF